VDVTARALGEERGSLDTIRNLQVPLQTGRSVALSQIATFEYGQESPFVWRRNRAPTLTVQADVSPGVLPDTVVKALAPRIVALNASLSSGYTVETGGIAEESAKSINSVVAVVPVMLFLTFTLLMIQLQSFQRLFLVLSVAPLGLIGVAAPRCCCPASRSASSPLSACWR
jgi:multidrug efflux pump subunit AcrB